MGCFLVHGNSEVAAGNATGWCFYFFVFEGWRAILAYLLCVCVNTFILNLKLIKYHLS